MCTVYLMTKSVDCSLIFDTLPSTFHISHFASFESLPDHYAIVIGDFRQPLVTAATLNHFNKLFFLSTHFCICLSRVLIVRIGELKRLHFHSISFFPLQT